MHTSLELVFEFYLRAKRFVFDAGYWEEVDLQERRLSMVIDEATVLEELAWVVLNSGMRETVVRRCFAGVSSAFFDWGSARRIVLQRKTCRRLALQVFRNQRKIDAIIRNCEIVASIGVDGALDLVRSTLSGVRAFAYIGPITSLHLAKNLGVDIAKPDRHLVRIAKYCGFESVSQMCNELSLITGDRVAVVDLVLWRYASLRSDYEMELRRLTAAA